MQYKQSAVVLFLLFCSAHTFSQTTTYLPQGARESYLLERLEIKAGRDSVLNFSKIKPFSRRQVIPVIERYYRDAMPVSGPPEVPLTLDSIIYDRSERASRMTAVDVYNAKLALQKNNEFSTLPFESRKPLLGAFYKTPANALEVNTPDFYLSLNPVFQYIVGKERGSNQHIFLNTRGVSLRGHIANKIGFMAYITENQERDPLYVQEWVAERKAVPGVGYFKSFKGTGYDYFDARGTVTFNAAKFVDVSFGYDKSFIGNGHRSLFLSDFSNNALFLRLNTRVWKLNYQNLFMELVNAHPRAGGDPYLNKKYAAIHHLDLAVTKWLNVGLYEAIVFGRPNRYEFSYLNPVIFYRSAEQQNGSFDNAMTGLDFKANVARKFQFYGQLLLDEFSLLENTTWWGNKYGLQLGGKYVDAFGIKNLDLQMEWNRVRPFTYSHYDSVANFTHDNQPLAHPLGANFNEVLSNLRYQFAPKWLFQARTIYYKQGRDSSAANFGSNIFLPSILRTADYGYEVGSGALVKVGYASFLLSYEVRPNLFFETNAVMRRQNAYANVESKNTFIIYAGIRWNMHRREFEF